MAFSMGISTSQGTDAGNNTSTVYVSAAVYTDSYTSYYGMGSSWSINIGGAVGSGGGPSSMAKSSSFGFSWAYTFTHNANGYREAVGTAAYFSVPGYPYNGGVGGTTYGAIDYDRKPGAPASATATLNSDKSITVVAGGASSPAGAATYYVQYASSSDNGATWTAFGGQQTMSGQSFTWTTLLPGLTYKFRVWATNSDGTGPSIESNSLLLPSGFKIKTEGGLVHARTVKIKDTDGVWKNVRTFKIKTASGWVNTV